MNNYFFNALPTNRDQYFQYESCIVHWLEKNFAEGLENCLTRFVDKPVDTIYCIIIIVEEL